jgi:hypothetical protein
VNKYRITYLQEVSEVVPACDAADAQQYAKRFATDRGMILQSIAPVAPVPVVAAPPAA